MNSFIQDADLRQYTTLKIGGPAKRLYNPASLEDIRHILLTAQKEEEKLFVLGNGSNVLFNDEGYDGWILRLADNWSDIQLLENNRVKVQSGASNAQLAQFCLEHSLAGYEFASGIPGTIGGAVMMNAGAYTGETKDVIESVRCLDQHGTLKTLTKEQLNLSYRHSWFSDHFGIIIDATYAFKQGNQTDIETAIQDFTKRRWDKQPMDKASAGSTFKRPQGSYASKLIAESGLKGYRIGDAMVSDKHAGFLINAGNCDCKTFLELVQYVQNKVEADSGIRLELEIKRP
jgi:UDP-N-acetylmuramate dehydrogenase